MKTILKSRAFAASLSCFLFLSSLASARKSPAWPYEKLTQEADLIIIAMPTAVRDTEERTTVPNVWQGDSSAYLRPISAIGVETSFEIFSFLKGHADMKAIVLHHLREANNPELFDGPRLVSFDPKDKKSFLLFLKREADGRYAPLTGQTDPADGVKLLDSPPFAAPEKLPNTPAPTDGQAALDQLARQQAEAHEAWAKTFAQRDETRKDLAILEQKAAESDAERQKQQTVLKEQLRMLEAKSADLEAHRAALEAKTAPAIRAVAARCLMNGPSQDALDTAMELADANLSNSDGQLLLRAVADAFPEKGIPVLKKFWQKGQFAEHDRDAIQALGEIASPAAIDVLFEVWDNSINFEMQMVETVGRVFDLNDHAAGAACWAKNRNRPRIELLVEGYITDAQEHGYSGVIFDQMAKLDHATCICELDRRRPAAKEEELERITSGIKALTDAQPRQAAAKPAPRLELRLIANYTDADTETLARSGGYRQHVTREVLLDETSISDVTVSQFSVSLLMTTFSLKFTEAGGRKFAEIAGANTGRKLALVLDGVVLAVAPINEFATEFRFASTGYAEDRGQELEQKMQTCIQSARDKQTPSVDH